MEPRLKLKKNFLAAKTFLKSVKKITLTWNHGLRDWSQWQFYVSKFLFNLLLFNSGRIRFISFQLSIT